MTDRAGFLEAILADPADDNPRAAYADWLQEQPSEHDRLHGAFIAAGLVLHHAREPEEGTEGVYYDAIRAQNASAPAVLAAQIEALFGWPWGPSVAWTNGEDWPGRITLRLLPPASEVPLSVRERRARRRVMERRPTVVWERGCVTGVRLQIAQWLASGAALLSLCPIEWCEPLEVPGLKLLVIRGQSGGWRLGASLDLARVRYNATHDPNGHVQEFFLPAANIFRVAPTVSQSPFGLSRDRLVGDMFGDLTMTVLEEVRTLAGDRWPGPPG